MVVIYYETDLGIQSTPLGKKSIHLLDKALWIDLLSPSKDCIKILEDYLKIHIPRRTEVEEIEPSSRLYEYNGFVFVTVSTVAMSEMPEAKTEAVTFMLSQNLLLTLRYTDLYAFDSFRNKLLQSRKKEQTSFIIFTDLMDAIIDRLADTLENISHRSDELSTQIFHSGGVPSGTKSNFKYTLQSIGLNGDLSSKVSVSLITFIRATSFLGQVSELQLPAEAQSLLAILIRDVNALREHATFLSNKINFLLDATLGMINIEQNNIIKIFSVAAVIFLPPTLIASIYGMNFRNMPELGWHVGYPLAVVLMLVSAWLPFRYFKKKKWL